MEQSELVALCGVGFAASLAALLIGFVPPSQFGSGNVGRYIAIVGGGALGLGLLVPYLFYRFRKPSGGRRLRRRWHRHDSDNG